MINLWPFNIGSEIKTKIAKQREENVKLSQEHQEVTARIIQKAERIAKLARQVRAPIIEHSPRPR